MSRALLAALAAVAAALLLASPALAFERSTDDACGVCFYWQTRAVPYVVNPPGDAADGLLEASCGGSFALDAVRSAFSAWTGPSCTDLALADAGVTSTSTTVGYQRSGPNENLIVFRKGICDDLVGQNDPCWDATAAAQRCDTVYNCFPLDSATRSTIALTTVTYSPSTGQILDADMELVAWDGLANTTFPTGAQPEGWYFTCQDPAAAGDGRCTFYGDTDCYSMDLRNTVTHEAGHFIGLAHPCEGTDCGDAVMQETTMYPSASVGEIDKRDLEPDDEAGVCAVYPAGAASPTCPSSCAEEESSGCGCGTASPSGLLSALLGLVALAPRLRRRRAQDTTAAA